jgi:uncharacterized protein (UPF0333 family)
MDFFKNNRGQVGVFFLWVVIVIIFTVIAAIIAPIGVVFNTEMVAAAENIYTQANESLQQINDPTIKAEIQDMVNTGLDAGVYNTQVNNNLWQYMWLILLIVVCLQ